MRLPANAPPITLEPATRRAFFMDDDAIAPLAEQLLERRTAAAIKHFRRLMDKDTARAVINHPSVTAVDRGAISLALAFGGADRWGRRDSQIFQAEEVEPQTPCPPDGEPRCPPPTS